MKIPRLVYADEKGSIYDHPYLEMAGSASRRLIRPRSEELIPIPEGSELFFLPKRYPVGFDKEKGTFEVLERNPLEPSQKIQAVTAFMAPAYTQLLTAAYKTENDAAILPLFSYTAVGWDGGQFYVSGFRVDPLERQDIRHFDRKKIEQRVHEKLRGNGQNRLIKHLSKCALTYGCPAARNYFLGRWEVPLPTSPACNANCLGCISLQKNSGFCSSQDRIAFVPTPEEIAEIAVPHLMNAPDPVVSFGQGCEGEPLLQGKVLEKSVSIIRNATGKGTINLNTNGSKPGVVDRLMSAGLDSIRVSINSCREDYFTAYYRPQDFSLDDLQESLRVVKKNRGFASINYLMLPGLNDEPGEFDNLCRFIDETGIDLIQMRNVNIDPEWYLKKIGFTCQGKPLGFLQFKKELKIRYPNLKFGYFNPYLR